jgi:hypothetical protein
MNLIDSIEEKFTKELEKLYNSDNINADGD